MPTSVDGSRIVNVIEERVAGFAEHWSMGSKCDRTDAALLLSTAGSALALLLARKAILLDLAGPKVAEWPWSDHLQDVRERIEPAAHSFGREAIAQGLTRQQMVASLHALPFWTLAMHGTWRPVVEGWAMSPYASAYPAQYTLNARNGSSTEEDA